MSARLCGGWWPAGNDENNEYSLKSAIQVAVAAEARATAARTLDIQTTEARRQHGAIRTSICSQLVAASWCRTALTIGIIRVGHASRIGQSVRRPHWYWVRECRPTHEREREGTDAQKRQRKESMGHGAWGMGILLLGVCRRHLAADAVIGTVFQYAVASVRVNSVPENIFKKSDHRPRGPLSPKLVPHRIRRALGYEPKTCSVAHSCFANVIAALTDSSVRWPSASMKKV